MKSLKMATDWTTTSVTTTGPQQRQDDPEEQGERPCAIAHRGLVELARNGGHEGAKQDHREAQPVGDLDQDHAVQRLEDAQALHDPYCRHDGRRDDQADQHHEAGNICPNDGRRCMRKPTRAPNTTSRMTLATVRMVELMKAVISM